MLVDFDRALKLVLVDEGGFDDDPHDHGGRTAHGIIQREYDAYRERLGLKKQDVWKISDKEYTDIYHSSYWNPWCDQLPPGLDYVFFDTGVNAGPGQAIKTLQEILKVRVDGHMGSVTLAAVEKRAASVLIRDYSDARGVFYHHLRQFPRYGRGWMARVNHVEKAALVMAAGQEPVRNGFDDELKAQATARANADDVVPAAPTPVVENIDDHVKSWLSRLL